MAQRKIPDLYRRRCLRINPVERGEADAIQCAILGFRDVRYRDPKGADELFLEGDHVHSIQLLVPRLRINPLTKHTAGRRFTDLTNGTGGRAKARTKTRHALVVGGARVSIVTGHVHLVVHTS